MIKTILAPLRAAVAGPVLAQSTPTAGRAAFPSDGVNPDKAGYAAMAPVADAAIRAALAAPVGHRAQ